uniref:Vomeronasal type-1 receptor n=1 Tax=Suricata suricatta TaxID=37032 RepID=A0A673UBW1_SURSU
MDNTDLAIGLIFLIETTTGILGNFSLLCHYIILFITEYEWRSTDFIHKHLIVANVLALLCKGVPQTMAAFGRKYFLSDLGCKLLSFLHRTVGRGMSISNTCLLTVFQTITISPMNPCWKELKVKAPKYVGFSIYLCWILFMLINYIKNFTEKGDLGYCVTLDHDTITISIYPVLIVFPEASFCVLTIWTSGCMVFILHRHKQWVQHIHSTNVSPRSSAETRATQSILILVSTFVSFYFLSSIFHVSWLTNWFTWGNVLSIHSFACPYVLCVHMFAFSRISCS